MSASISKYWEGIIKSPLSGRENKPRKKGLTMIIDKGLGFHQLKDILELNSNNFDYLKLGFGTSALYPHQLLIDKIALVKGYGIDIYPGGTFFEVAFWQENLDKYLLAVKNLGFTAVEISDGTIDLDEVKRFESIEKARNLGLIVISEVGKKDSEAEIDWERDISLVKKDLKAGSKKVIIEGRESGKGVGIYDESGNIKQDPFDKLLANLPIDDVIFETPLKKQQQELIECFGPNVNLGNINPNDLLALETLRLGLRGDTFKLAIANYNNKR